MDREETLLAFVQGRLPDDAAAQFEREIAQDPDLAAEVAVLASVRREMAEADAQVSPDGWNRLSASIDADQHAPANLNHGIRLSLLQVACVAMAAIAIWQFVAAPMFAPDAARYTTASATSGSATLQITFDTTAAFGEISDVLYELEGTVVDGPSAIGLYRVSFPDDATRDAAAAALAARDDLVKDVFEE